MIRSTRGATVLLMASVLFVVLLGAAWDDAEAEVNRWQALASTRFTQGHAQVDVHAQPPCEDEAFAVMDDIFVRCLNLTSSCEAPYHTSIQSYLDWRMVGLAGFFPPPPGDVDVGAFLSLEGQRMTAQTFAVDGSFTPTGPPPFGTAEVAVIRYSGDPTVFDGFEAWSVHDLVDLGLIAPADILHETEFEGYEDFQFEVDVSGLEDDAIVIFAVTTGPIPPCQEVPATTVTGLVALILVVGGLGGWMARCRRRRA